MSPKTMPNLCSQAVDETQLCSQAVDKTEALCVEALETLERTELERVFHDAFLKSCARVFLRRECVEHADVLIQAPKESGKSTSIAMFDAAMAKACPGLKLCVYTTCRQKSSEMLQSVLRFVGLIGVPKPAVLSVDDHELKFEGGGVVASYSSKVCSTRGMDSDVIIIDDAALVDPAFIYETVAPALEAGGISLICISTPTNDVNVYSRMCRHPAFQTLCVH